MSQGNRRFACPVCKKVSMEGKVCGCDITTFLLLPGASAYTAPTALEAENAALKARVAELEAEVERLRVIELPEIGRAYAWCNNLPPTASQLFSLRMFGHNEDGDFIWSPLAHAFVALLNEGRKV